MSGLYKRQFTIQIEDYEEDQIQAASAFNLSADKSVSNKFTAADTVSDSSSKSASVQHISMQPSSEKSDSKIATAPSSSTHNEISSYDSLALAVDIGTTTIASNLIDTTNHVKRFHIIITDKITFTMNPDRHFF